MNPYPSLVAVALLAALTFAVLRGYGTPRPMAPSWAILRGALQLALISIVLGRVIASQLWVGVALLVMFAVAASTAARRIGWSWAHLGFVVLAMSTGIAVTLTIVFVSGAIEPSPRYALAIGGIVIGNAMTTATLTGTRFLRAVDDGWDGVEAWLALGATPRLATYRLARGAVHTALVPSTDQTKTTGLVTLPGAFVGAIFGGVSPLQAGQFQIVVLASIMAAGSITSVLLVHLLAPVRQRPTSDS